MRLRTLRSATTPSASSTADPYITREEAAARYGGTPGDIFQGDIYRSVEVMIPRPTGGYRDYEPMPVIVVSHDCEWSKVLQSGRAYKIGVAPLRRLASFSDPKKPGIEGTIQKN